MRRCAVLLGHFSATFHPLHFNIQSSDCRLIVELFSFFSIYDDHRKTPSLLAAVLVSVTNLHDQLNPMQNLLGNLSPSCEIPNCVDSY